MEKHDIKDGRKCFRCREAEYIAENGVNGNKKNRNDDQIDTAMVFFARKVLFTIVNCQ